MRGRRADVDADGPQAQALGRDVAGLVVRIFAAMMVIGPMRMRRGQSLLDADRELIHPHLDAVLRTALEVGAMDLWVLILVLDLVAALGDVLVDALVVQVLGQLPLVPAPADREVAGRVVTGVEVLVPPASGRDDQRA